MSEPTPLHPEQCFARLAVAVQELNQQAAAEYAPIIEAILHTHSLDKCHIERTLDGLLDFCGYKPALQLYRRLCRYYWDIDSAAATDYVNAYRITWDTEETNEIAVGRNAMRKNFKA
ncbi:MAG: hypothetical protein PHP85_09055 [Gallionella sp.]|nr:hypothetical protein [Gallionella sp.]